MGKEQELLEAARNGNVAAIEKLVGNRSKRGGGLTALSLSSLRKAVNINCTDSNGDTPLHLASLGSHSTAVQVLLQHDASPNISDDKGCTPLHLAAWTGCGETCKLLLTSGSIPAQVNNQNNDGDTALHCAAQYGHSKAVAVLLENKADSMIRNLKEESPLDLAAQYGRLEVVQHLLSKHPALAFHVHQKHSPLHLAARYGHPQVVDMLLKTGFEIDLKTSSGTALHEACCYCKSDVINLLLQQGIDASEKDSKGTTAIDILNALNTQKATQMAAIITDYIELCKTKAESAESANFQTTGISNTLEVHVDGIPADPEYDSPVGVHTPFHTPTTQPSDEGPASPLYAKPNKLKTFRAQDPVESITSPSHASTPPTDAPPLPPRNTSMRTSTSSPPQNPDIPPVHPPTSESALPPHGRETSPAYMEMRTSELAIPQPCRELSPSYIEMGKNRYSDLPKKSPGKPPRRKGPKTDTYSYAEPDPSDHCTVIETNIDSDTPSTGTATMATVSVTDQKPSSRTTQENVLYEQMNQVTENPGASDIPAEVTDTGHSRLVATDSLYDNLLQAADVTLLSLQSSVGESARTDAISESSELCADTLGKSSDIHTHKELSGECAKEDSQTKAESCCDSTTTVEECPILVHGENNVKIVSGEESEETKDCVGSGRGSRPPSLEFDSVRSRLLNLDAPLTPTGYSQPPTPDHPPPSPHTAVLGIHERINPMDKRKSRDIETFTEPALLGGIPERDPEMDESEQETETKEPEKPSSEPDEGTDDVIPDVPSDLPTDSTVPSAGEGGDTVQQTVSCSTATTVPEMVTVSVNCITPSPEDETDSKTGINSDGVTINGVVMRRKSRTPSSSSDSNEKQSGSSSTDSISTLSDKEMDPFSGLLRGSQPGGSRNVVSQIYQNVVIRRPKTRYKRRSAPSAIVAFDPLMEREDEINAEKFMEAIDQAIAEGAASGETTEPVEEANFDDSEEWAKISAVVRSYGGRLSMAYRDSFFFEQEMQKILSNAGAGTIQSVGDWLDHVGLGQYENTLVANGFDDLDFIGGNIIENKDLKHIGIENETHRKKICEASRLLLPVVPIGPTHMPSSVEEWLFSLRLSEYWDTFKSHDYTTMERVRKLWELELATVLDITTVGHRKRMLASLGERQLEKQTEKLDVDITEWKTSKLAEDIPKPQPSPIEGLDFFKDYTKVKPVTSVQDGQTDSVNTSHTALQCDSSEEDESLRRPGRGLRDSAIHIRPPHLAHTTSPVTQWRHQPEKLIKGCCNYAAQYLGSSLVKELNGIDSTREGMTKMKKSADAVAKVPIILLSISYKGVKFIDAKSKRVVCEHEIGNIFCACQDPENLNFFAYITKDLETNKHYCHVFSVRNTDLAREVILTLGEAFEIAYQLALKEKAEEDALEFDRKLNQGSDADDSNSRSSKTSLNTI